MIDSDRRGKEQKKYNQYDYEDRILRDSLDGLDFRPKEERRKCAPFL
jgi:hypothetical protein